MLNFAVVFVVTSANNFMK